MSAQGHYNHNRIAAVIAIVAGLLLWVASLL